MVEIGSVIPAKVVRVEPYGVYLQHDGESVIVLAPEVSWLEKGDLRKRVHIGETYNVLALRYNYKTNEIVGSIRRLHPEDNPYRQLSRLPPGTVLKGKIECVYRDGASVLLPNGAHGNIPNYELKQKEYQPGEEIEVIISAIEVEEGIPTLRPFHPDLLPPSLSGPPVLVQTP